MDKELYVVCEYSKDSKPHFHGAFNTEEEAHDYIPTAINEAKKAYKKSLGKFATIMTYDNIIRIIMGEGRLEGPYNHTVIKFSVEKVKVMD